MNAYPKIAKILKEVEENKISFKNAIYKHVSQNDDSNFKKIYKLVIEILKNKKIIYEIINSFFDNGEDIRDQYFFMILIYEKFFSNQKKNQKIGGKLMRSIKEKEEVIKKYITQNYVNRDQEGENKNERLYFRINLQRGSSSINFENFQKDDFIKELYYIEKSGNSELVKEIFERKDKGEIIMQTKSSCLPAYLLKLISENNNFGNSFDIIDCCSAPGNKTLQLAEYFNSKVFAFEINKERFDLLNKNVKQFNFTKNILTINDDFLNSDPTDPKYSEVKIILADPSCSGSGTSNNSLVDSTNPTNECVNLIAGSYIEKDQIKRLIKLAKFQKKIIEHCMKFPNVKYISYSTCSIYMTENEYVVNKILKNNPQFQLVNLVELTGDSTFHKGITEGTEHTLRTCRKCKGIDGFYVAVFERKE